jgi:uncharacterized protein YjbI with pentapeptide repeats
LEITGTRPDEVIARTPTPEDLRAILDGHEAWARSRGQEGRSADLQGLDLTRADLRGALLRKADLQGLCAPKADLSGAKLDRAVLRGANLTEARLRGVDLSRADLRDVDLAGANLAGADLSRADLRGANVRRAVLRDATLADADLSETRGLLPGQLGGAQLAGAKLPAEILKFEGLANVAEASKSTQSLFTTIVLVCAYTWLTIASTADAQLLNNAAPPSSRLPILGIDIPLIRFYMVAPLLLLSLYVYFQLGLQRLWEELSELPAVFPDGRALDKKAYPWLLNVLVRAHLPRLKEGRSHLARWQARISVMLAWGLVPATILFAWARYLRAHDWTVTGLHIALLAAAAGFGLAFLRLAASTLRGSERRSFMWKRAWKDARALGVAVTAGTVLVLSGLSAGVIEGVYPKSMATPEQVQRLVAGYYRLDPRRWLPQALDAVGLGTSADLTDASLSTKPTNWTPNNPELLDSVKGADLENRNLRHAMAFNAFGANSYLQQSDLRWADFREADLRRADFRAAQMRGINFRFADVSGADFRSKTDPAATAVPLYADLTEARFKQAKAEGAKFKEAILHRATFSEADLSGADLEKADLTGADLTQARLDPMPAAEGVLGAQPRPTNLKGARLDGANLTGADLSGADLRGASLRGARFDRAKLAGTLLRSQDLTGATGLTREQLEGAILDADARQPPPAPAVAERVPPPVR